MVNRLRGEVGAVLDGVPYTLCLTLGALAELETTLGEPDLGALVARFEGGRLTASDAIRVIGAGLRGGGASVDDAAVARMRIEGAAGGFVDLVAALLMATFTPAEVDAGGGDGAKSTPSARPLAGMRPERSAASPGGSG